MKTNDYRNNVLKQLQAKGKLQAKGAKTPLLQANELIDSDGLGHFDQYRNRLDTYHRRLYSTFVTGESKYSNKQLDDCLTAILLLLLTPEKTEEVVKTYGSHTQLVSHRYGKALTEKAKAKIKTLQAQIKKTEEDTSLSEDERLEKVESLEEKIKAVKAGNSYEVAIYRNTSEGSFRRQFEDRLILLLANLEVSKQYTGTDFTASKKWVAMLERATRCDGVDTAKVDSFKQACDFDGLKAYVKGLEAAYKAAKLEQAKKTK